MQKHDEKCVIFPAKLDKSELDVNTPLKNGDTNIQYSSISKDVDDKPLLGDLKDESKCKKFFGILVTLTVEPMLFFYMCGYIMNMVCLSNMIMDKGCLYYYNYSAEVCKNIKNDTAYSDEKTNVESLAASYILYANLLSLIGAFFMMFIAPWSDKYGRKPPLFLAILGAVITDCGLILCTIHFESDLGYIVLSRLPSEMFGGLICVLAIIYSHASEVSSDKTRTLKYTTVELGFGLGMAFGGVTGGFIYQYFGYYYVYVTVAIFHVACLLWCLFVLEETRGLDVNVKWSDKAKDFFIFKNFKEGIVATCRRREGNTRTVILLLILSMCTIVLNYESLATIGFLYVHHIYNWDPTIYSIVNTSYTIIQLALTFTLVPVLIKVCKASDYTLGLIGVISMILKSLIIAVSKYHEFIYYIALATGLFAFFPALAVRTGLSKIVDREEVGKVFSFLATCEAVIPILGNAALTGLLKSTIDFVPNVSYTVSAFLLILPLVTFLWARRNSKTSYISLSISANDRLNEKI